MKPSHKAGAPVNPKSVMDIIKWKWGDKNETETNHNNDYSQGKCVETMFYAKTHTNDVW